MLIAWFREEISGTAAPPNTLHWGTWQCVRSRRLLRSPEYAGLRSACSLPGAGPRDGRLYMPGRYSAVQARERLGYSGDLPAPWNKRRCEAPDPLACATPED